MKQVNTTFSRIQLYLFLFKCALATKNQPNQDTNNLKDQLSVVIKAQLDIQQKDENQITMMQTVCQLVNNEIISTKKPTTANSVPQQPPMNSARTHRDRVDFQTAEPRQNWPTATNNTQVQRSKMSSADELLSYTQRMNTGMLGFYRLCFY